MEVQRLSLAEFEVLKAQKGVMQGRHICMPYGPRLWVATLVLPVQCP